jgi:prephenate dehydrogenase
MTAAAHDRQLAWTSHLPQAVASGLAAVIERRGLPPDAFGPGARDAPRLAASNPDLWTEIFLQNRDELLGALDAMATELGALRDALARRDGPALRALLATGRQFRERLEP